MLVSRGVCIRDSDWTLVGVPCMKTVDQCRTADEQQEERARPVERATVDFVGGRPEGPEEL
jgi:hypothetical protein